MNVVTKPVNLSKPPSRMSLNALVKGRLDRPLRVVIHGPEGVGKTTFGAGAPNPIFIGAEDGTSQLDVTRFQSPETWSDVHDAVSTLTNDTHDFKTLVLDTLDWSEPLLWEFICKRDDQKNVEAYGYGKGYNAALDEWRVFLASLERLRAAKSMHIVLIAHSWIKPFKNPEGDDFDRYELKLNKLASGKIKEWSDAVLFANYETVAHKDQKTKRVRGIDTGARLVHTQRSAAFDAKNRLGLPETMPLSWGDFEAAAKAGQPADPEMLTEAIQEKAGKLGGTDGTRALEAIKRAKGDATKLAQLNDWANAKLAEKDAQ